MTDPMNEMWRAQQDAATRLTESWRTLLQPATGRTARTPSSPEAEEPAPQLVDTEPESDTDSDTTDEAIEPEPEFSALDALQAIQVLRDGQRELAQDMTRWAELHRDLADAAADWASRQRDQADALDRLLAPFSAGTAERST